MTFKDLDQNRLQFVIRNATGQLLSEFYKKNQKRLIIDGIKIQIIPKNFIKGVELFANFNQKAISLAREWFDSNMEVNDEISLDNAINAFHSVENNDQEVNTDSNIENSKVIFKELLKKEPNPSLIEFMRSEIKTKSNSKSKVLDINNVENLRLNKIIEYLDKKNDNLKNLELDELLILSIINSDANEEIVSEAKNKAFENNINFDDYESLISKAKSNKIEKEKRKNADNKIEVTQSTQLNNDKEIDVEDILVIGTITNIVESSGNRFIRVIGIIENKKLYELSQAQKQHIFPDSGDIIWYVKDSKRLLQKNEIGLFKVMHSTFASSGNSISTKFAVHEFISKLNQVRVCNESRFESKALTNWFYKNETDVAEKYSYVLANNKLIKPHKINNQKIDFDRPMDVIVNSDIYKVEGNYLTPEFAATNSFIDLSSSESYLKKLLKNDDFGQSSFTKNQITRLIEEIKLLKEGHDSEKISEILEDLNELVSKQDVIESLIKKFSDTVEVKNAIDEIVKEKSADILSKKNELANEVRQLEQQKNSFSKTIEAEKEQYKKLKISFSNDIKDIFQKAIINGRGMLAESAFFQALITTESLTPVTTLNKVDNLSANYGLSYKEINNQPFVEKIKLFPYKTAKTKKLIETLLDCSSIGLTIGLKGGASGIVANLIAESLSNNSQNIYLNIEIRPGVSNVDELSFDELVSKHNMVFLIKNFDIAPISIYGHDMVDICYLRALDTNVDQYPKVIVTFEDSGLGLDIPNAFRKSMIVVDLDNLEYEDKNIALDEYEEYVEASNLQQSEKYFIKKLIGKIHKSESSIGTDSLPSLIGLLDHFYLKPLFTG